MFMSILRAASWGHPLQDSSVPLGALIGSISRRIVSLYCRRMRQQRGEEGDTVGDESSSADIRLGDKPRELRVFEHGFVRLDDAMATDLSVVNSARVSFAVRKEVMEEKDRGLIRFLMRERHGT